MLNVVTTHSRHITVIRSHPVILLPQPSDPNYFEHDALEESPTHTSIKTGYDDPNTAKSPNKNPKSAPRDHPEHPSGLQPQTVP